VERRRVRTHAITAVLAALLAALTAAPALAQAATWSGYATLGYARSNSAYTYQRFISRSGSFKRDSLLAGQLDLSLAPQWSATVQARLAPAAASDSRWRAEAAWAFVAWRPDNDWLVRAGKLRLPLYLYSESMDVGVAHDMARLPHEMYSIAPTNDFKGLFVTRALGSGGPEISLDAYAGRTEAPARFWFRDGMPPYVPAGPFYRPVDIRLAGLVLNVRDALLNWRIGVVGTSSRRLHGTALPVSYPWVDSGGGLGYWRVDESLPGPDIPKVDRVRNHAFTGGAEWQLGAGWRVAGEFVRMHQRDTELASDSRAGYLAVFKRIGAVTPYLSVARQRSTAGVLEWQRRLTGNALPAQVPDAARINALQRMAGEALYAFDQRSTALGVAYALTLTSKLKAEWMHTRVGAASDNFDVPTGQPDAHGLQVNTLTVNLNVAF
jgi:hypothetical protein